MNLVKNIMPIAIILSIMVSCASSKIVLSNNVNIDKYKYVIFGNETSGDRELNDVIMAVENCIGETGLKVLSSSTIVR